MTNTQKDVSMFHMLALTLFYCFCGGEFKVKMRFPQCFPDNTYTIIMWRCKGCGYQITSDFIEKEFDWEGLR